MRRPTRIEIEEWLRLQIEKQSGRSPEDADMSRLWSEIGIDSLSMMELIALLEGMYGISFEDIAAHDKQLESPRAMCDFIHSHFSSRRAA